MSIKINLERSGFQVKLRSQSLQGLLQIHDLIPIGKIQRSDTLPGGFAPTAWAASLQSYGGKRSNKLQLCVGQSSISQSNTRWLSTWTWCVPPHREAITNNYLQIVRGASNHRKHHSTTKCELQSPVFVTSDGSDSRNWIDHHRLCPTAMTRTSTDWSSPYSTSICI